MSGKVRILHAHSTFDLGGKEARSVRLINAFGAAAEHTILSAVQGALSARAAIEPGIAADFPRDAPSLAGRPGLGRLYRLARFMARHDLVLTHNWGAFDMVMARRLFAPFMRLPPLVHHEDGFNQDEAVRTDPKRNLYRRLGLGAAYRLIVPSLRLEGIARNAWHISPAGISRIGNGIALPRYGSGCEPGSIPGLSPREGEIVVGTVAGLRRIKNLPRLVRAFAAMRETNSRLVIVGEGPESEAIAAEARRLGVASRLVMPGFIAQPWRAFACFDIFALSSDSEQFPISLVEAMAAGLPAVATRVGDIAAMVAPDNLPLLVEPADEPGFAAALDSLAAQPDLRRAIGRANRAIAMARYDEKDMIGAYAALYGAAIGRSGAFAGTA